MSAWWTVGCVCLSWHGLLVRRDTGVIVSRQLGERGSGGVFQQPASVKAVPNGCQAVMRNVCRELGVYYPYDSLKSSTSKTFMCSMPV